MTATSVPFNSPFSIASSSFFTEKNAIGQTRQRIVVRDMFNVALAALQFGDISIKNNFPAAAGRVVIDQDPAIPGDLALHDRALPTLVAGNAFAELDQRIAFHDAIGQIGVEPPP